MCLLFGICQNTNIVDHIAKYMTIVNWVYVTPKIIQAQSNWVYPELEFYVKSRKPHYSNLGKRTPYYF